jgi:phospholipid transport system substrate-binding protein
MKGCAMNFHLILAIVLLCLTRLVAAEESAQPAGARQTVDKLNTVLLDVMKNAKTLGYQGRHKKLDPIVRDTHDFNAIARIALGSHWNNLNDAQKQSFIQRLTDLSIATYAAQFNGYAGEEFKFESEQGMRSGRVLVRYALTAPREKPVKFEYIMTQTSDGQWNIVNIIVDGISDLALKKAQYTSVIDREGFDSLMNKLSQKITDYASNNPSG